MKIPQCAGCDYINEPKTNRVCLECPHFKTFAAALPQDVPAHASMPVKPKKPAMTMAEAEYGMRLRIEFPKAKISFESISLKMSNGHRYTPDWIVENPGDKILCVEVKQRGKNGFRQASYGRAKLAYDQCKQEFDCFNWRWAEKYKGEWQ